MIKLENINKNYVNNTVLEDFNLEITESTGIVSLIGPNGAGKSTLLRLLCGILDKNKGKISILMNDGYIEASPDELKNTVAFISASERMLYYKLSVIDNITYFNILKGMSQKSIKSKMEGVLADLDLAELKDRRIETLSTGQKRKVSLGCILCSDKSVVILDEPTLGLDYDSKKELKAVLQKRADIDDKLFIISSHDFNFLGELASENIFILNGKVMKIVQRKISENELTSIYESMEK